MRPSVLHVVQSGDRGGVQRHIRDLANGLPDLTAGVAVGACGWMTGQVTSKGIKVATLEHLVRAIRPARALAAAREVTRVADALGATILHAHGVAALAAILHAVGGRPLVYTPHGFQWRDPAHGPAVRSASWLLHKLATRRLTAVVAVCDQDVSDAIRIGFPQGVVRRIANGIQPPPAEEGSRTRSNMIGTAVRLVAGKGLKTLLQAVALVPPANLVVAGDGPLRSRLVAECTCLGISDKVEWLGWRESLEDFYRSITVYATLSAKEGMPYSLLDALSYRLPVLATDIPGHRQLLRDGENGLLVPVADAEATAAGIRRLLLDVDLRAKMARSVATSGQAFALGDMLAAHRKLYWQLDRVSALCRGNDVTDPVGS